MALAAPVIGSEHRALASVVEGLQFPAQQIQNRGLGGMEEVHESGSPLAARAVDDCINLHWTHMSRKGNTILSLAQKCLTGENRGTYK